MGADHSKVGPRLRLLGRGSWRMGRPLTFEVIGGARGGYLNIRYRHDQEYVTSLTPAEARRLAAFLDQHYSGREASDG